jgi:hypothetical protein
MPVFAPSVRAPAPGIIDDRPVINRDATNLAGFTAEPVVSNTVVDVSAKLVIPKVEKPLRQDVSREGLPDCLCSDPNPDYDETVPLPKWAR